MGWVASPMLNGSTFVFASIVFDVFYMILQYWFDKFLCDVPCSTQPSSHATSEIRRTVLVLLLHSNAVDKSVIMVCISDDTRIAYFKR